MACIVLCTCMTCIYVLTCIYVYMFQNKAAETFELLICTYFKLCKYGAAYVSKYND